MDLLRVPVIAHVSVRPNGTTTTFSFGFPSASTRSIEYFAVSISRSSASRFLSTLPSIQPPYPISTAPSMMVWAVIPSS